MCQLQRSLGAWKGLSDVADHLSWTDIKWCQRTHYIAQTRGVPLAQKRMSYRAFEKQEIIQSLSDSMPIVDSHFSLWASRNSKWGLYPGTWKWNQLFRMCFWVRVPQTFLRQLTSLVWTPWSYSFCACAASLRFVFFVKEKDFDWW